MHDWLATRDFISIYQGLSDRLSAHVDDVIRQLIRDPNSAWARQGRVVGAERSAWIIESNFAENVVALYWTFDDSGDVIILVLLIVR